MKISKVTLLTMSGIFTIASLGLMFFSVSAIGGTPDEGGYIQLHFDPDNAIQHFQGVKIIATEYNDDSYAIIKKNGGLVGIETDYNFLMSRGDTNSNNINRSVKKSSILGGKNNKINGGVNETILGGEGNRIISGDSNTILGGSGNILEDGEDSVIFGGEENKIKGNYSSIAGGEGNEVNGSYAAAVGNNNKADGYNSVAMGLGSKVSGKNSFLWRNNSSKNLLDDNVFVVDGENGMVINTTKSHTLAKLTVGGSLIIYEGETAPTCKDDTKGVLKVINTGNQTCFCSCDGTGRNAVHDGAICPFLCKGELPGPVKCGSGNRVCNTNNPYTYTGTCENGTVIQGTGAFFLTTDINGNDFTNYINRSCQSYDGKTITGCQTELDSNSCVPHGECTWNSSWSQEDRELFSGVTIKIDGVNYNPTNDTTIRGYTYGTTGYFTTCSYYCKTGYIAASNGFCYECLAGTWNEITKTCEYSGYCDDGRSWSDEEGKCVSLGVCLTAQNGDVYKGSLGKIKQSTGDILPPLGQTGTLKCIDGDMYTGTYKTGTCTYECQSGYYCKDNKCTKPFCTPSSFMYSGNGVFTGTHPDGTPYTSGDYLSYYTILSGISNYTFLNPQAVGGYNTTTGFIKDYKNKTGCWYSCDRKNRRYVRNDRFYCVPEDKAGGNFYCARQTYKYNMITYTGATGFDQPWKYVNPKDFEKAKENGGCIYTCETGSVFFNGARVRDLTDQDRWIGGKTLIFSSTASFCYKPCKDNEYLNGHHVCQQCKGHLNPDSYQTGFVKKSDKEGKVQVWSFYNNRYENTEAFIQINASQTGTIENEFNKFFTGNKYTSDSNGRTFGEYRACLRECKDNEILRQSDGKCHKRNGNKICGDFGFLVDGYRKDSLDASGTIYYNKDDCPTCYFFDDQICYTCKTNEIAVGNKCETQNGVLKIKIENLSGNDTIYKSGDRLRYKLTFINSGNLAISGIKYTINMNYTGYNKDITKLYKGNLKVGSSYVVSTGTLLTNNIFSGLNGTGNLNVTFKIVSGTLVNAASAISLDVYATNPNSTGFTVTIKK